MKLPRLHFPDKLFSAASLAIIGAAIMLIIAGILYFVQQERQRYAINKQTETTNQLIREVKALGEDNKKYAKQARDYAYCNAVLLAKYTQTQEPIVIDDLDKCVLTSFPDSQGVDTVLKDRATVFLSEPNPTLGTEVMTPSGETVEVDKPVTFPPTPTPTPTPKPDNHLTPAEPLLTIPNVLQLNTPCLNVLGLVKTCKQ